MGNWFEWRDDVGALVVRIVHIHPERAPVAVEGMAIAADGQPFQKDSRRTVFLYRSKTVANLLRVMIRKVEGERDLPKEDRGFDRILRSHERNLRAGKQDLRMLTTHPRDRDANRSVRRDALQSAPHLRRRPIGMFRDEVGHCTFPRHVEPDDPCVARLAFVPPEELGRRNLRRKHRSVQWIFNSEISRKSPLAQGRNHRVLP